MGLYIRASLEWCIYIFVNIMSTHTHIRAHTVHLLSRSVHGHTWPLTSEVSLNPRAVAINSQEMLIHLDFISVSISKRTYCIRYMSEMRESPAKVRKYVNCQRSVWKGHFTESGRHLSFCAAQAISVCFNGLGRRGHQNGEQSTSLSR